MKMQVKHNDQTIGVIDRIPFNKGFFGNFIPHWARYKGKEYLVQGGIDYAYMHGDNPLGVPYWIEI